LTAPKQKKVWKNQERFEPLPLDYAILTALPDQGAKIGNYLWDGKRADSLAKELDPKNLTANMVSGRLSTMHGYGLVVQVKMLGGGGTNARLAYQRTQKGAELAGIPISNTE